MWGGTDFTGATSLNAIGLVIAPKLDITAPAGEILEQPYARSKSGYVAEANKLTIKHYMSTAKIWGVNRQAVHDENDFSSAYNTNPSNGWYWFIYCFPPSVPSSTMYMAVNLKITYYAEFYLRATEGIS